MRAVKLVLFGTPRANFVSLIHTHTHIHTHAHTPVQGRPFQLGTLQS